jgi:hypothetical protein
VASRHHAAAKALVLTPEAEALSAGPATAEPKVRPARAVPAGPRLQARELQNLLDASVVDPASFARTERRWSPRRMLAFAFLASATLWCGIAFGVYLLISGV